MSAKHIASKQPVTVASDRRIRALHTNSKHGCLTCKKRHVKCDEAKPVCTRCSKGNKTCSWAGSDSGKKPQECTGFRAVVFGSTPAKPFSITEDVRISVDYFKHMTLPAAREQEPSTIWAYIDARLYDDESLCYAAATLGHHQRAQTIHRLTSIEGERLHLRALRALGKSISTRQDGLLPHLACCLLFVMLQQFRAYPVEFETHLKHGLSIILNESMNDHELQECKRLFQQITTSTVLFNSLSREANDLTSLTGRMAEEIDEPSPLDSQSLASNVHSLALNLLGMTLSPRHLERQSDGDAEAFSLLSHKIGLHQTRFFSLEHALEEQYGASRTASPIDARRLGGLRASCLLIGIFLRCMWTGLHCPYDAELESFRSMVATMRSILPDTGQTDLDREVPVSVAHGGMCLLFFVTLLCREPTVRREAMSLMSRCPQQDGRWNREEIIAISKTIIESEEDQIDVGHSGLLLPQSIPEQRRIHFFRCIARPSNTNMTIRVFRRDVGGHSYEHEDISVEL